MKNDELAEKREALGIKPEKAPATEQKATVEEKPVVEQKPAAEPKPVVEEKSVVEQKPATEVIYKTNEVVANEYKAAEAKLDLSKLRKEVGANGNVYYSDADGNIIYSKGKYGTSITEYSNGKQSKGYFQSTEGACFVTEYKYNQNGCIETCYGQSSTTIDTYVGNKRTNKIHNLDDGSMLVYELKDGKIFKTSIDANGNTISSEFVNSWYE